MNSNETQPSASLNALREDAEAADAAEQLAPEECALAEELSGPALRIFFRIAALWQLSADEQMTLLGGVSRPTLSKWKDDQDTVLSKDTLHRISYILGIYKALQILLPSEKAADNWIRWPNTAPLFGGKSALDRMLSGQMADLSIVRRYLDSERGGWR